MVVPSYILFLCYVHSSSCCIDNTSFVATTSTTINLFTSTSLHVVAPHCAAPNPALRWSCSWWHNFRFPTQLFTQFLLQGLMSGFTVYWSPSLVQLIMSYFYCGHPLYLAQKMISIYGKFKISGHSVTTKKTHDETGHSHSETVPYWTTGMIHCCIECTEKRGPYNTTCVTVIMESKHWNIWWPYVLPPQVVISPKLYFPYRQFPPQCVGSGTVWTVWYLQISPTNWFIFANQISTTACLGQLGACLCCSTDSELWKLFFIPKSL